MVSAPDKPRVAGAVGEEEMAQRDQGGQRRRVRQGLAGHFSGLTLRVVHGSDMFRVL